eukprot:CAMPEP_0118940016 /NCGR_PEP_ID=MMETSP1169-20130426/30388_1 /TAXON_ID=36882 /ORGANISM="Pyramimonas obovata, Strain CCMP722" /LENGTH=325 /DNA_ID=CAMNT_0006884409 /DNA_START=115 /DNA_END=1092 /DNA_ORIENTATION=-
MSGQQGASGSGSTAYNAKNPPPLVPTAPQMVTLAATQFACGWDLKANVAKAEETVRKAAKAGANIILLQELFESCYFCQEQHEDYFALARPMEGHPTLRRMAELAKELGVVLPVSFFELAGPARFNSVVVFDADGTNLGLYRKTHIPDGPGYQEKFYFNPGDTGFKVFQTGFGNIGVGICWDQWFPEAARAMVLKGAEILLYPTAIGSEPQDPSLNSFPHWQRTMQGHAAANLVPLVASNRIGTEEARHLDSSITFYGGSFIADPTGEVVVQASDSEEVVILARFDLTAARVQRHSWGIFRDRRPDCYGALMTLDGKTGQRRPEL